MPFITPMYAAPMPKTPLDIRPGLWALEEKLDGHRLIVEVKHIVTKHIIAWSRNGLQRSLPRHILDALVQLPVGIYDGELLVPGKRSYGVTEIVNGPDLVYVVFDAIELLGVSTVLESYDRRRAYLTEIFNKVWSGHEAVNRRRAVCAEAEVPVWLAPSANIQHLDDVDNACRMIWERDGEGVILKRRASRYSPGKRPKGDWIKVKQLRSAVLTIVGFQPSRGEIQNRGPYATVVLRDAEGYETTVKTLNDAECRRFEDMIRVQTHTKDNDDSNALEFVLSQMHPAIGRRLVIEYQERTPDGSYRHPRWDRWAEEGE